VSYDAAPGSVCRKWSALTSDDELWRKLFNDRWGADAAAFYAPDGSKSSSCRTDLTDVFPSSDVANWQWHLATAVEQQFSRSGTGRSCISLTRGIRIIREGKDYYYLIYIYQGEIQGYLGYRQDKDTDVDCGKNAPR